MTEDLEALGDAYDALWAVYPADYQTYVTRLETEEAIALHMRNALADGLDLVCRLRVALAEAGYGVRPLVRTRLGTILFVEPGGATKELTALVVRAVVRAEGVRCFLSPLDWPGAGSA